MGSREDSRSRSESESDDSDRSSTESTNEQEEGERSPTPQKKSKKSKSHKKSEKKLKKKKSKKDSERHHSPGKKRHRSRSRSHSRKKKSRKESKDRKKSEKHHRHSSSDRKSDRSRDRIRSRTHSKRSKSRDRREPKLSARDRSRERKHSSRSDDRRRGDQRDRRDSRPDRNRSYDSRKRSDDRRRSPSPRKTPQLSSEELTKQRADLAQRNREKFRLYASGELDKALMTNGSRNLSSDSFPSPTKKRKPTVHDAFGDSSGDSGDEHGRTDGGQQPSSGQPQKYGSFKIDIQSKRSLGRPSWKGGWLKSPLVESSVPPASNASMPTLTPAPVSHSQSGGNNLNNGMPTLTPKPGIKSESESEREDHHHHTSQSKSRKSNGLHSFWDRSSGDAASGADDEKPEVKEKETGSGSKFIPTVNGSSLLERHLVNGHSNGPVNGSSGGMVDQSSSVLEDISDDEMDISDSDEYDENEMNASLDETTSAMPNEDDSILEKDEESSAPVPVPAPPPLRPRPSRFSDSPNVITRPPSGPPPLSLRGAASLKPITIQNDKCKPIERKFSNQAPTIDHQSEAPPPKTPEFKKINEPEYQCSKDLVKAGKDSRKMECECRPNEIPIEDIPCGEDCFNRVCFIECSNRCRFGERCTNRNFQKRKYKKLEIFWTNGKGHGLKALENISDGEFIIEYLGEVVTTKEFTKRSHEYSKQKSKHHYFMELTRGATIDATRKGQISRFINHSCEPNCETQKWTVNGLVRIGFFASRDICIGEEITFDYQFIHFGKGQKCLCGSEKCRGIIGREAAYHEYKKIRRDEKDIDYAKEILGMKILDSTEDMMKLGRWMAFTKHDDLKARQKSLSLVKDADPSLQRTFMSYHGLDILWSFAKDDQFDEGELRPDLIDLLFELPISIRDKVEDSGLLAIVEKWSKKRNHSSSKKAKELVEKWQKCLRRIPLRPKSASDHPSGQSSGQLKSDHSESNSNTPEAEESFSSKRRRSPRLAPVKEEMTKEELQAREERRGERRRKFEEQVKWEAEAKEAVKGSIDDRLRAAMENDSDSVYSDAPSPDPNEDPFDDQLGLGPKTPEPKEPIQWHLDSYWEGLSVEEMSMILQMSLKHFPRDLQDLPSLDIGFGKVVARSSSSSNAPKVDSSGASIPDGKDDAALVLLTSEELTQLNAIKELARVGLQARDRLNDRRKKEDEERKRIEKLKADKIEREKRRIEVENRIALENKKKADLESNENQNRSEIDSKEKADEVEEEILLPVDWATAKDAEGNIYYYHLKTRETTWDKPKLTSCDLKEKENKLKRQLERFIGELLLSYRDPDAQVGRITKDDDYRHLIKRLAYGLLKRVISELKTYKMGEKAKNMASKYCHKYMLRQGPVYLRKLTSTSSSVSTAQLKE